MKIAAFGPLFFCLRKAEHECRTILQPQCPRPPDRHLPACKEVVDSTIDSGLVLQPATVTSTFSTQSGKKSGSRLDQPGAVAAASLID